MKVKVRVLCAMMCLSISVALFAQEQTVSEKDLWGNWDYVMEDPMSGGNVNGICTIEEKDGETKALFKMNGGDIIETTKLTKNSQGIFYAIMTAQGYELYVYFEPEGEEIHCAIDTGGFEIPIEMKRTK